MSTKRRLPMPAGGDSGDAHNQPHSPQQRELVLDTMGSWALEGMKPTSEALDRIRAFADGHISVEDAIKQAHRRGAVTVGGVGGAGGRS